MTRNATELLATLRADARNHLLPFDDGHQFFVVVYENGRRQAWPLRKPELALILLESGLLRRDDDKLRLA